MPHSFHRPRYCGVQTLPLKMHYRGENGRKLGKEWSDFDPNELDLTFGVPDCCAKFHKNQARIAIVGEWTDRQM